MRKCTLCTHCMCAMHIVHCVKCAACPILYCIQQTQNGSNTERKKAKKIVPHFFPSFKMKIEFSMCSTHINYIYQSHIKMGNKNISNEETTKRERARKQGLLYKIRKRKMNGIRELKRANK